MKLFMRVVLLVAMAGFLSTGSFSSERKAARQTPDQNVQVINMTAKKYVFNPSPVHVKKGAKVQLRVTSLDREHGLKINVYPDGGSTKGEPGLVFTSAQDCWSVPKGQTVTIEFVAKTAGSYPFKCCKFCGFGHMGMKGQIIVDE
ncbi:MAG TPA: cupredoxin domain-containing protein [Candidatus Acidoferrales bacterium]|nr:cupredoxin domain-containing protein [Candidatus Acidoferrales bacterium]